MSETTKVVLKLAFGFVSNNHHISDANNAQDGDLTEQRSLRAGCELDVELVCELDDIKIKFDAISRKDLCMSISCLQQGIQRLVISFDESVENGNPSTSTVPKEEKQLSQIKPAQSVTVEDAVKLANAVGKMKAKSNERFQSAKQSFIKAGEKASEAFHNAALSTSDRIFASKVRIASGILENVDDPFLAASDCLHYLQELHNMPAIKEVFSVNLKGGIKSFFRRDLRQEMIATVTTINLLLADFVSRFTMRRMGVLDWPMIECDKQVVHPIHYEKKSVEKMREMEITPPWNIVKFEKPIETIFEYNFATNTEENILRVFSFDYRPQKLDRETGEWRTFNLSPSNDKCRYNRSVFIDDNNVIYVVSFQCTTELPEDTILVYNSVGTIMHHCQLNFNKEGVPSAVTITKDKKIVFCCFKGLGCNNGTLYVCDIADGRLIASFPIRLNSEFERVCGLFVSSDNEISVATAKYTGETVLLLYVYTQQEGLKRSVQLRQTSSRAQYKISFDHATKNYVVCSADISNKIIHVECVLETGELRNSLFLDGKYIIEDENVDFLIGHNNGTMALVNSYCALYLQNPLMKP